MPASNPKDPRGNAWGKNAKANAGAIKPAHIPGVRKVLIAHGYQVSATGGMTDRLLSAWRNYRRGIHQGTKSRGTGDNFQPGARTPAAWNKHNPPNKAGLSGERIKAKNSPPAKTVITNPKHKNDGNPGGGNNPKPDPTGKKGPKPPAAPAAIANADGLKLIPTAMAKQIADLQFGGDVNAARQAIAQTAAQNKGNLSNIGDWTKQVQDQLAISKKSTAAGYEKASAASLSDSAKIAQSMGGDVGDNVRASGLAASNLAHQQEASSGELSDRMGAIMQQAALQARTNEQNLGSQRSTQANLNLQDVLGKQGAAQASTLMDILQKNNAIKQQKFSNTLSALQTQAALSMSGVQQANLLAQTLALNKSTKTAGGGVDWKTNQDKQGVIAQALAASGAIDTKTGALKVGMTTDRAKNMVRMGLFNTGYKNAKGAIGTNKNRNSIQNQMLGLIRQQVAAAYKARNSIPQGQQGAPYQP